MMTIAILLGALAGLAVAGTVTWWVFKTFWDSYQTIRLSRKITRMRRKREQQ